MPTESEELPTRAAGDPGHWDACGIGVAVRDLTVLLHRYPRPDEKVPARDFEESGGGPVPTALVTLARFGRRCAFIGLVGRDDSGRRIRDGLAAEGVDVTHLERRERLVTPTSIILVHGDRRTVCEHGQAGLPLGAERLERIAPALERCRFLIVDGRFPELQLDAAERVRRGGGAIVVDAGRPRPGLDELIARADAAILSHDYFKLLRQPDIEQREFVRRLSKRLPREGLRIGGLTLGADGCLVSRAGEPAVHVPGIRVDVVDTTGAGDVFHGAFVEALLDGADHVHAARFANAAAALKCRGLSGRAPLPAREVIEQLARRSADERPPADRSEVNP